MTEQPTPVDQDANATATELLARAAADYAQQQTATHTREQQGGTGHRDGILPSGGH